MKYLVLILLVVVMVAILAATYVQTPAKPSGVSVENTTEGVQVSWNADSNSSVHRIGWAHRQAVIDSYDEGDWLEAFHFADTLRQEDYTITYLPDGESYWFIVGAGNERFGLMVWGDWNSLVVEHVEEIDCSTITYIRSSWGRYPKTPSGSIPLWSKSHDNLNLSKLSHDHHVALKDAHLSGACIWNSDEKDTFSSDWDNLNPTSVQFNSSKGSRTPDNLVGIAKRVLNTPVEKCAYASQHYYVKEKYDLSMTDSESTVVTQWLALCTE